MGDHWKTQAPTELDAHRDQASWQLCFDFSYSFDFATDILTTSNFSPSAAVSNNNKTKKQNKSWRINRHKLANLTSTSIQSRRCAHI
jgi:hypothetical protein